MSNKEDKSITPPDLAASLPALEAIATQIGEEARELAQRTQGMPKDALELATISSRILGLSEHLRDVVRRTTKR